MPARDAQSAPPAGASEPNAASPPLFDAGAMGCGEIVLELRFRLADMPPGALLAVHATDTGVREDLPAWCRMTGHTLLTFDPPHYILKRRPSP